MAAITEFDETGNMTSRLVPDGTALLQTAPGVYVGVTPGTYLIRCTGNKTRIEVFAGLAIYACYHGGCVMISRKQMEGVLKIYVDGEDVTEKWRESIKCV